jgi:hypothetical protein
MAANRLANALAQAPVEIDHTDVGHRLPLFGRLLISNP